jgi:hypothetical protein
MALIDRNLIIYTQGEQKVKMSRTPVGRALFMVPAHLQVLHAHQSRFDLRVRAEGLGIGRQGIALEVKPGLRCCVPVLHTALHCVIQ